MNHKYLFVFREGSSNIFVSKTDPTPEDVVRVQEGMVDIIRLPDIHMMTQSGLWKLVDVGAVYTATIDGQKTPPFHVPITWAEEPDRNDLKN